MAVFYGYRKLSRPEAWEEIVGSAKWAPNHSAQELAFAWHGAGGIPSTIRDCLDNSKYPDLKRLVLQLGLVEKPVFLDTMVGPSMTDLLGFASNADNASVVIAVEGKADEAFGYPVKSWLCGDFEVAPPSAEPRPTRERRLKFLCERLGITRDAALPLRYQLLHRTVSGISEAQLHGAKVVVVLIHSFRRGDTQNWAAFEAFLGKLGYAPPSKRVVSEAKNLGTTPTVPVHFLWWDDDPRLGTA